MTDFRRGIGVFLFSAAFLLLELSLSRIFSVISFYHYSYMAISLALFGMAFGGVLVYLKPSMFPAGRTDEQLATLSIIYAVYSVVAMHLVSFINFDPFQPLTKTFLLLLVLILLCTVPFIIAGVILSRVFCRYRRKIGTMYAANLIGSGVGCLLVIPSMNLFGGPTSVIFAAFLSACAAVTFQPPRVKVRSRGFALVALILLALAVINPSTGYIKLRYSKGQNLENAEILLSRWNSFSRILVIKDYPAFLAKETGATNLLDPKEAFRFYNWSLSSKYDGPIVPGLSLLIDDLAGSPLINFDGDLEKINFLRYDITSLGYHVKEGDEPDVLIIGPGGGRDVLTALNFGCRSITGVELNPLIIDVAQNEFGDFTGRPYSHPKVELHIDEGRNFISRSKEKYDIIQIPLVDTWAATTSGAFSLSENNLYTVEAFSEYFDHLTPGGMLAVSRYIFDPPKQSLRVLSLFRAYCESAGIEYPERKCAVVGFDEYAFYNVGTIIMKLDDLSVTEMNKLQDVSDEMGYKVLWMPDGGVYDNKFADLIHTDDFAGFIGDYEFDISPATDNKPFFFHLVHPWEFMKALGISDAVGQPYNYMAIFTLMLLLIVLVVLTVLCIVFPLFLNLRRRGMKLGMRRGRHLLYFALIGAAFMLFEIAMIQKFILFLGSPIYSLAVVLFSLLVFTGIGAWLSDRIGKRGKVTDKLEDPLVGATQSDGAIQPKPWKYIIAISILILIFAFLLTPMFKAMIGLSIFWRCLTAIVLLAPMGLLLGFPFPSGIRMLSENYDGESDGAALIPYAYGLNGALSVLGSVAALILALCFGFQFNIYLGIILYLCAAGVSFNKS